MNAALKNRLFSTGILCVGILFFMPFIASGQLSEQIQEANLAVSPSLASPNSVVEVSLNAYSINTTGATITWYIDGNEQPEQRNERSISAVLGDMGEETTVRAVVSSPNSIPFSATKTIIPAVIDIIIEADTNIPIFYKGRALPGQGSPVRITALPFNGSGAGPSSFTYKWELNRKVLFGGPVRGKSTVDITVPEYKNALLSVEVTDSNGSVVGKKNINLTGTDPELHFYQTNPLRGLSRKAVGNTVTLLGEEITVRAEPYFMDTGLSESAVHHEWRIDGTPAGNTDSDLQMITLRTTGGAGNANVSFKIVNTQQLSQYADGSFAIVFE